MTQDEFSKLPAGIRMVVTQGNLDHWFNGDLWGDGSSIRPTGAAFVRANDLGLIERHATRSDYRLTDLGRSMRRQSESAK